MAHPLQRRLAAVRRKVRFLWIAYGLSAAVSIALIGVLFLAGTDYLLRFEDRGMRWIWSIAAFGLAVGAVLRFVVPALRSRLDDVGVAQRIEGRLSGAADHLSSAIEFLDQPADDALAGSLALRRAAVAQTEARLGGLDWSKTINRRPAIWAAAVAGCLALGAAAICLVRPADARLALARLANPLGDDAWPPVNDLAFTRRVDRLAIDQPFEVELIDRNHKLPDEVRIQYRTTDEHGAMQIEQQPMQLIGQVMVAHRDRVARSFDYRAEGGDDRKMAWIHVDVVEPPRIASLQVELHPPAYTGWPSAAGERRVVALRGTAVEMTAASSKPLVSAVLHQQNGPDVVGRLTLDGRGFSIPSLAIDKSGSYWFELRDRGDLVGGTADRWDIEAIADRPPTVAIDQPAADLFIAPNASVPIHVVAKDDLAIHQIALSYTRSDHTEGGETVIRLFAGPEHAPASASLAAADLAAGVTQTSDYLWELAPLRLPPGTQVLLTATATDYLPQTGISPPRRLTVITPQELEDRLAQRESMISGELERILKMQQATRLQTTAAATVLDKAGRLEKADVDQLRGDELSQRQVRRSLVSPTEGVRTEILSLLAELTINHVDNLEIRRRMQGLADETARLDRDELPAAERELTSALKCVEDPAASAAAARGSLAEAGRQQDAIAAALERMLGDLAQWNSFRSVSRDLTDIRHDQTDLEQATKTAAATTLSKDAADLTPAEKANLKNVAERQLDIARRFDKLQQRMEQASGQLQTSDPFSAESLADALHASRQQGLAAQMRDGADSVEQNRLGQALGKQASVGQGLDEMLDILTNRRERELSGLVKKLRQAEQQLAGLRQDQQGLQKKLKQAAADKQSQTPEESRAELQRLSRRERELQEEVKRLARELQRLQADRASAALSRAGGKMDQAARAAAGGDAERSNDQSQAAGKDLDEAQKQLAEARRQAEADLAHEQLARLDGALQGLVDRQQQVINETARLEKLRADQGQFSRAQAQSVHDLARDQQALGVETGQLGAKLDGAEAFQYQLAAAAGDMARAAERLQDRDTGAATQEIERDVLARLKQLTAALVEDKNDKGGEGGGSGGSGASGQAGNQLRTMAEVRLIRLMQDDLNRRTQRLAKAIGDKPPDDDQRREFGELTKEQGRLAELVSGLTGGGE